MEHAVAYLYNLIKSHHADQYEDVDQPDISSQLAMMLTEPDVVEDPYTSQTTVAQRKVEHSIRKIYKDLHRHNCLLEIERHSAYVRRALREPLPPYYKALDANHSWMLYWLLNSYYMTNTADLDAEVKALASGKIRTLIVDSGSGGVGGGKNQLGHVASTYAAVLALLLLEDYETLAGIRHNLYGWFMALKQKNGSFVMHVNGEADARSTYCVLVVASLLGLLTDDLCENALPWLVGCQTFEGGFAGVPNAEAHGGYTFCAVAAIVILLKNDIGQLKHVVNFDRLVRWCVARQYQLEGGLSGRTNKLVDACYSFWVGAVYGIIEAVLGQEVFQKESLKMYLLNCCQRADQGGFRDKPGEAADFYHTNYSLLGLSVCEHHFRVPETGAKYGDVAFGFVVTETGDDTNTKAMNPIFGIPLFCAEKGRVRFAT